jgi:hypothetical protein
LIAIEADGQRLQIDVWARDGREIEEFVAFLKELGNLLSKISDGAVSR